MLVDHGALQIALQFCRGFVLCSATALVISISILQTHGEVPYHMEMGYSSVPHFIFHLIRPVDISYLHRYDCFCVLRFTIIRLVLLFVSISPCCWNSVTATFGEFTLINTPIVTGSDFVSQYPSN